MSREQLDKVRSDLVVEQRELRIALKERRYDRAGSIAAQILRLVNYLRELDTTQSQEVAQ